VKDVLLACAMVLVLAFLTQIYSRLLGVCIFTIPAWLRVASVAVPFLCGRVWCDRTTCETAAQIHNFGQKISFMILAPQETNKRKKGEKHTRSTHLCPFFGVARRADPKESGNNTRSRETNLARGAYY